MKLPRFISGRLESEKSETADEMFSETMQIQDRPIGELIGSGQNFSQSQIAEVLSFQKKKGIRFGEAAVALKLATSDEVLHALSRQFHYSYSPDLFSKDEFSELVVAASPFSDEAEAFRELRSQLILGPLAADKPRRALAFLSPNVGDGKTFISANTAIAFSQLGGRTLLIDADMRTPRLHKIFSLDNSWGLSSILSGRSEQNAVHQVKDLPSLYVMPVGVVPPNPLELLQRSAFGILIGELCAKFDHVLVDTPAGVHGADARVVAATSGVALVISRLGKTRLSAMQKLLNKLGKDSTEIAGVVINKR